MLSRWHSGLWTAVWRCGLVTLSLACCLALTVACYPPAASTVPAPPRPSEPLVAGSVRVEPFATGLDRPTGLAFGPDGALYAADHRGLVWRLADEDGDGQADRSSPLLQGLSWPTALLWVTASDGAPMLLIGGLMGLHRWSFGQGAPQVVLDALPGVETFAVNDLALGPDGFVYLSQSTAWMADGLAPPQPGAVWRLDLAALSTPRAQEMVEPFAGGFRTPFGLAFSPSGAIYLVDSGIGWPADPPLAEEINLLLGGGDYADPKPGAIGPMAVLPAGAGATDVLFYLGQQWPDLTYRLVVAWSGLAQAPSAPAPPSPRLARVEIVSDAAGYHSTVDDFFLGLRQPFGLVEGPDGSLYVSDYGAGIVYRLP